MKKTIYFYNVFITHNGKITNLHLSSFIDKVYTKEPAQRLKNKLNLIHMIQPVKNKYDHNDRKITIAKYRDDKPFLGDIGTDRVDEINGDVLELTNIFYRKNSRLLIIEYNHYGARPGSIQKYLSSFLPTNGDDDWEIRLEPIEEQLGFQDIQNSKDIKKVEFKMDLTSKTRSIYAPQSSKSVLGNILTTTIGTHTDFGANTAMVSFGNGRKRKDVIDPVSLVSLLKGLDLEGDIFASVRIKYHSPTTKKVEEIDLKNQGVLKEVIEMDNNGLEYVCDTLEETFYEKGRTGENDHLNHNYEPDQLPI